MMSISKPEQKEELLDFCNHVHRYMQMATQGHSGVDPMEKENLFNLLLDEARVEEVIPMLQGFKLAKNLERAILLDRKEKMLSEALYEKTEDGKRKITEAADRYMELFEYTMNVIIQIRKIPNKAARAKLSAVARHMNQNK